VDLVVILYVMLLSLAVLWLMVMVVMMIMVKNEGLRKNIWGVLVGAFSDFGGSDTDNPVQNLGVFKVFEEFPESKGLI